VLIGIHLLVAIHIAHWQLTGSTLTPLEPSEAMQLSKQGIINAGAIFFALMIGSTLLFGRFFCGWSCHLVALQDLSGWLLKKAGIRPKPLRSRLLAAVPLIAFCYMFLWPVAYRIWIGDPFDQHELDLTTETFWATFPGWAVAILTFVICGFVLVYFLGAKGFCTYACPYGGIFGVVDRFAPGRIRVTDACEGCGHCTAVCTSNVRVHEEVRDFGMVVDAGCMKCMDCISVCPKDALYFGFGRPALGKVRRNGSKKTPKRRLPLWQELLLGATFTLAFFSFRGLYGLLPFLFSLGLGAAFAYLSLQLVLLVRQSNLRFRQWTLKRGGKLRREGWVFLCLMLLLVTFWTHSAVIRYNTFRGNHYYDQSADFRQQALALEPGEPLPSTQRSTVERAIRHLSFARSHGLMAYPLLDYRLAWMHFLLGQSADFEARVGATLAADPDNAVMHLLMGRQRAAEGRYQEAIGAYTAAINANPKVLNAHLGLGTLLAQLGDLSQAKEVFRRADAEIPNVPELYFNSGLIAALEGNSSKAIELFEEALALNAEYLYARENLAGVLASVGRFRESKDHYRRAIEQSPEDPQTRYLAARVHIELGEWESAEMQLREALRLAPGLQSAQELLQLVKRR
jgi:tetratricopeptide (TPR) repeat protein/NAD-dependent dihydropyrimidine dehydrogenase PreA subunit